MKVNNLLIPLILGLAFPFEVFTHKSCHRYPPFVCLRMILAEKRSPLFGIMRLASIVR